MAALILLNIEEPSKYGTHVAALFQPSPPRGVFVNRALANPIYGTKKYRVRQGAQPSFIEAIDSPLLIVDPA